MASSIPQHVKEWTRDLLGARGFILAWNDPKMRKKLDRIGELITERKLTLAELHTIFLQARNSRDGLDAVLDRLEKSPHPAAARSAKAASPAATTVSQRGAATDAELSALRAEIVALRSHARDLEILARALTERAVFDATRIQGLETVLMGIAQSAGLSAAAEELYASSTARFLEKRCVPNVAQSASSYRILK